MLLTFLNNMIYRIEKWIIIIKPSLSINQMIWVCLGGDYARHGLAPFCDEDAFFLYATWPSRSEKCFLASATLIVFSFMVMLL